MTTEKLNLTIAGYRCIEELYSNSKTIVYRAKSIDADVSTVVIKVLRSSYPTYQDLLRFRHQYTITKNLDLPGIIRPDRLVEYNRGYALVMEDCDSTSLAEYRQHHPLTVTDILAIGIQIAETLHSLHQQQIIHKDIKPANILIHPTTKQVKLIDFGIASLLPRETQEILTPNLLEGTLPYLSPEQTGRMNRGIDYRTDFYALGVTLYQLLTGKLPFETDDPIELIHCHLAQVAQRADLVNSEVPAIVGQIVAKLMAKNAEERYQTALGLKYDLEYCEHQWRTITTIGGFELGQQDICDRFIIPEKLYGREEAVKRLLDAFDRVAQGSSELMQVVGYSGIGKTAAINEVHKPIVRQRGYFIKGKFDQFNRNIPFSAFVRAFRDLMGQLLGDGQLEVWKEEILAALGDRGQVIIDVIPELEDIIGSQPAVTPLEGVAAQNRFNLLFQKFIRVFTTPEHPLVIFLDDLQWVDSASLHLIQLLMTSQTGYLLLIAAYRDNEVGPVHPWRLTLELIKKTETPTPSTIDAITLQPLALEDLNALVVDTLHCNAPAAEPLTHVIYRTTQGNPFFATQLLKALHQGGQIEFDREHRCWQCDLVRVRQAILTDDVVKLMTWQLEKLPLNTQEILKFASCIGDRFDLTTLAIVSSRSPADAAIDLWPALEEGLILPQSAVYKFYIGIDGLARLSHSQPQVSSLGFKFLHDRVQQAAYTSISPDRRELTHLIVGRRLFKTIPSAQHPERVFEIVGQFNRGIHLINDPSERENLAQLNCLAATVATKATAYTAALEYARIGIDLLDSKAWTIEYELALSLHQLAIDAAYLTGQYELMDLYIPIALQRATSRLDLVGVYETQILALTAQKNFWEAVKLGLSVLGKFGFKIPMNPSRFYLIKEFLRIKFILGHRQAQDLLVLTPMTKQREIACLRIAKSLSFPAFMISRPLLVPLARIGIELSSQAGNSPLSPFFYMLYGTILVTRDRFDPSYQFATLAKTLLERNLNRAVAASVYANCADFIDHFQMPLKDTFTQRELGFKLGLEHGDLLYTAANAANISMAHFYAGFNLEEVKEQIHAYEIEIEKTGQLTYIYSTKILKQTIDKLIKFSDYPGLIIGSFCDERKLFETLERVDNDEMILATLSNFKLILAVFYNHRESSFANAIELDKYVKFSTRNYLMCAGQYFYASIARLSIYNNRSHKQQTQILKTIAKTQQKLKLWAKSAPSNYQHKYDLIAAERYRVLGQTKKANDRYDRAIAGAKKNGFVHEEALANELAARFCLESNQNNIAAVYIQEAYYAYARWGATAKVQDLEQRYGELLTPIIQQQRSDSIHLSTLASITHSLITNQTTSQELEFRLKKKERQPK
jgi:predicted ATPase